MCSRSRVSPVCTARTANHPKAAPVVRLDHLVYVGAGNAHSKRLDSQLIDVRHANCPYQQRHGAESEEETVECALRVGACCERGRRLADVDFVGRTVLVLRG
jgi:hypothetical protein